MRPQCVMRDPSPSGCSGGAPTPSVDLTGLGADASHRAGQGIRASPIVVVGAGNLLMRDDGVGVHALRALSEGPNPGVALIEMGTAVLHALGVVEAARRVLVLDAVHGGRRPGTLYAYEVLGANRLPAGCSLHSMGLLEALRFLSIGGPASLFVIGVEPQTIGYGIGLTAPVRAAVPHVVALARRTVGAWRESGESGVPDAGLTPTTSCLPLTVGVSS